MVGVLNPDSQEKLGLMPQNGGRAEYIRNSSLKGLIFHAW